MSAAAIMSDHLRKVIFPTAGMGTRFLPATKASPKEMLTIVDKPLIQYGVEEALATGLDQVVMVTGRGKRAIEDHFDVSAELENNLRLAGKESLYKEVSRIAHMADVAYIRQKQALGLGHAIYCARHWVGKEYFAVSLADELIIAEKPALQQLREIYKQTGASVIGLTRIPKHLSKHYGMVEASDKNGLLRINGMIEKPDPAETPSDLAIIGRYILSPSIFSYLKHTSSGIQGEIQLTDAIHRLAKEQPVYGVIIEGDRFDAGNPLGFLKANAALGVRNQLYGAEFKTFLRDFLD
ncbi:MAG: UTP--glucose-1-phosphate uridylyltransferase GalU [Mariprofundaceae bacterium]